MDLLTSQFNNIGNAIGWTLIHFLWQGSLLFLCYCFITRLLLKNKINFQYWIGIAFISLSLIIPLRELIFQLGINSSNSVEHQFAASFTEIKSNGILNPIDILLLLIHKLLPYIVITWVVVVLLISTHLIKSWHSLVKLSKIATLKLPDELLVRFNKATKTLKLKFKPVVTISKKIDIPATFGYFKPIILLPVSLINKLPQDQMEAIILHELCHIKRADFLHNILQLLVETLFFYHPLVKWISRDVRKVREQCCDELVLKLKTDPLVYAKALTNIATIYNSNIHNKKERLNLQIAANDGELFNRIKFLMIDKRSKAPFTNVILALLFSILALLVLKGIIEGSANDTTGFTSNDTVINNNEIQKNGRPNYLVPNVYDYINRSKQNDAKKTNQEPAIPTFRRNKVTAVQKAPIKTKEAPLAKVTVNNANIESINTFNADIDQAKNSIIAPTKTAPTEIAKHELSTFKEPNNDKTYPKLIKRVYPNYQQVTQLNGAEGEVILSFNIDSRGRVKKIKINKRSPMRILDTISKQALRRWRFDPLSIDENNIKHRYQQIFRFKLDSSNTNKKCFKKLTGTHIIANEFCKKTP
jgi:TonB family protein